MAKIEGDNPNFDELTPLDGAFGADDDLASLGDLTASPLDEETSPLDEEPAEEPLPDEAAPLDDAPIEDEAAMAEMPAPEEPVAAAEDDEEEEIEPSKLPLFLEVLALIVVPLGLLALASNDILGKGGLGLLSIWTALYFIGLGLVGYALWKSRATSDLYTVFLGCVVAGLLTGVYILWMELAINYKFDISAQQAKKVSVLLPTELRLPAGRTLQGPLPDRVFMV
ncbi:MAG: hypothetical protein ABFC96_11005 [Thermoguttaceae bacterium]